MRPALSIKGRVLRLLSQREHSRAELARKLADMETASGDLAAVLDDFVAKGLISEERLTQSVLNQRANKLVAMRLRAELHQKGVSTDRIREAVDSLKSSESARAQGVWYKRFKGPPEDAKAMAKQVRFLAARGFDAAAIRAAVPPIAYSAAGVSAADDEYEPALNIDDLFMDDGATP